MDLVFDIDEELSVDDAEEAEGGDEAEAGGHPSRGQRLSHVSRAELRHLSAHHTPAAGRFTPPGHHSRENIYN